MSGEATARNVLVVDDDRDLAESMAEYLELEGHRVRVELSGAAGLRAVEEEPFDYVLLDVGLPGVDGIAVMRAIERIRPGLRVILITGYSATDLAGRVDELEGAQIITKPMDPAELGRLLT